MEALELRYSDIVNGHCQRFGIRQRPIKRSRIGDKLAAGRVVVLNVHRNVLRYSKVCELLGDNDIVIFGIERPIHRREYNAVIVLNAHLKHPVGICCEELG